MFETSAAVVLYTTPYNDHTLIVHLYTRVFGRVGYLVRVGESRRGKRIRALLTPFSVLEVEVQHKPTRSLQQIREIVPSIPLHGLHGDPVKCAVALFLAELFSKVVQESDPNPPLFDFLSYSIQILDREEKGKANFHLAFLIQLAGYLGCYPNTEGYRPGGRFDLLNGNFAEGEPLHPYLLSPEESRSFVSLMRMDYRNMARFRLNRSQRNRILDQFILYLQLHHPGVSELKSTEILRALFD